MNINNKNMENIFDYIFWNLSPNNNRRGLTIAYEDKF